jgi:hypothetical protein
VAAAKPQKALIARSTRRTIVELLIPRNGILEFNVTKANNPSRLPTAWPQRTSTPVHLHSRSKPTFACANWERRRRREVVRPAECESTLMYMGRIKLRRQDETNGTCKGWEGAYRSTLEHSRCRPLQLALGLGRQAGYATSWAHISSTEASVFNPSLASTGYNQRSARKPLQSRCRWCRK